jgi:predicted  nucleic acid-binding Zn-ribbon protein
VEAMVRRIGEIEARLYGGQVSASRELSAMAGEVEHLQALRSGREDQILALMEEIEPLDADLASLEGERRRLEADRAQVLEAIRRAEEAIGAEEAEERQARRALVGGIPANLMGQYERLRAKLGGVGAARLVNGSCTGCHLSLPSSERERVRHLPPEAVVTCEQCGRILVR